MSRRRNPSSAERAIVQLAAVLADPAARRPDLAYLEHSAEAPLQAELMAVRHLAVQHLGRWVELSDLPRSAPSSLEPSSGVTAGRLVGLRPGVSDRIKGSTRVLVLQQGTSSAPLEFDVARPVLVAPREWS